MKTTIKIEGHLRELMQKAEKLHRESKEHESESDKGLDLTSQLHDTLTEVGYCCVFLATE